MAILAFVASFVAFGWRPGDPFPTGAELAAASGAAFLAVICGQAANAFACRSSTRLPWTLGWWTNPLLVSAVGVAIVLGVLSLTVSPIARLLTQAVPPPAGIAVALLTAPAILLVDLLDKRWRGATRRSHALAADERLIPGV